MLSIFHLTYACPCIFRGIPSTNTGESVGSLVGAGDGPNVGLGLGILVGFDVDELPAQNKFKLSLNSITKYEDGLGQEIHIPFLAQ